MVDKKVEALRRLGALDWQWVQNQGWFEARRGGLRARVRVSRTYGADFFWEVDRDVPPPPLHTSYFLPAYDPNNEIARGDTVGNGAEQKAIRLATQALFVALAKERRE